MSVCYQPKDVIKDLRVLAGIQIRGLLQSQAENVGLDVLGASKYQVQVLQDSDGIMSDDKRWYFSVP